MLLVQVFHANIREFSFLLTLLLLLLFLSTRRRFTLAWLCVCTSGCGTCRLTFMLFMGMWALLLPWYIQLQCPSGSAFQRTFLCYPEGLQICSTLHAPRLGDFVKEKFLSKYGHVDHLVPLIPFCYLLHQVLINCACVFFAMKVN